MDKNNLLEGSVTKHMIRLALPAIGGMLGFTIFNLTDTYFVSALGTDALAAMGFTFPIVMIVSAISAGISAGAGSMLSRAKGAGDAHLMQRIATDGILLSLIGVIIFSIAGLLSMDWVFTMLGADSTTLPLVKQYMTIWYSFVFVVVTPPVSDTCMRASGDMIRPLVVMLVCSIFNIILDPLLIHGYWIFPEMGIRGAAWATIISRILGMITTLYFAAFHHKLINFKYESINELWSSWKSILSLGLPSVTTQLMPQILRTIMTNLAAVATGTTAVAALAAGTRIESFPNIVSAGIGVSLIPLIGQNWGAKKYDRVFMVRKRAIQSALIYGMIVFAISIPLASIVVRVFTDDPEVIRLSSYYLWILLFSSAGLNLTTWMSSIFTIIGKPKFTFILNVFGVGLVTIPLAILGNHLYGYIGMLLGVAAGQIILGAFSVWLMYRNMHVDEA